MTRILLVEDDPDVLSLFEEVLLGAGYQVDAAATFREADNLLASQEYNLLLSDGRLPDGTGVVLADKAKARGIRTLIVTGFLSDLDNRQLGTNSNTYTVLRKPLTPFALLAAINTAIAGSI
jgi:two-component system, NtrC family, response regulator PilR